VIVGGPGSEAPWAGYGRRSIAMAATRMLARVLHDEAQPLGVRVHLLSIDSPVRSERPGIHECPEWPTTAGVARHAVQLVDPLSEDASATFVACGRGVARAATRFTQSLRGVPAFLESLKTSTK
jgi:hypothetical protein